MPQSADKSDLILQVCNALRSDDNGQSARLLRDSYPADGQLRTKRNFTAADCMKVFWRDGFIDRYSGQRLVFPGTLRLISIALPLEFPFHPHWRTDVTHPAYWELFPTIDHEKPVARGGLDTESNWLTTSQLRNSAKANWTLEELGWQKHPPGDTREWDGLVAWFMGYAEEHRDLLKHPYLNLWHKVAKAFFASAGAS